MNELILSQIAADGHGRLMRGQGTTVAVGVEIDSRREMAGRLFVALAGEHFDGHDFVMEAARRGAVGAMVARGWQAPAELPDRFAVIEVPDTLLALQQSAAAHRRRLPVKVLAITGSNGKTSTKEMTAAVLGQRFRVRKNRGNFNNHIGLPLSLFTLESGDEWAVMELGMSHPGEIGALCDISHPNAGIITNIGVAHIEFFGNREAIAKEKGKLAEVLPDDGFLVLNAADDFTSELAERTGARVWLAGAKGAVVEIEDYTPLESGSRFVLVAEGKKAEVRALFAGRHMAGNAALAAAAGLAAGLSLEEIATGLEAVVLEGGRLEEVRCGGLRFLNDTYNANPDSMVAALETLVERKGAGRALAVLGGMGELGDYAEKGYARVGERVGQLKVDMLIGVGPATEPMLDAARGSDCKGAVSVEDPAAAARLLQTLVRSDDLILLKASRSERMERVLEEMEKLIRKGAEN